MSQISETKMFKALGSPTFKVDIKSVVQICTTLLVGASMYYALRGEVNLIKAEMIHDREKIATFVPEGELNLQFKTMNDKMDKLLKAHGI